MAPEEFLLAVKSTLDKEVADLSIALGKYFFDLDGSHMQTDKVESQNDALACSFSGSNEYPRDPFYQVSFDVYAKTSADVSQYNSLLIVSRITSRFAVGASFKVRNYSSITPDPQVRGLITCTEAASSGAGFDKTSGFRPVTVSALVHRFL